jgi:hypothetical protein
MNLSGGGRHGPATVIEQTVKEICTVTFPNLKPSIPGGNTCGFLRSTVILGVLLIMVPAIVALGGCSGDSGSAESTANTSTGSEHVTLKAKDPVTKEAVTKMVTRKVGSVDYAGDPIIRKITLSPEGGGTFVDIAVGRPPSCHPGQVVGYITEMSRGFMSSLFLYPDVVKVQVTLYGTTEDHSTKNDMAARDLMTKADADKIDDWFKFDENTIGQMSTEYWVEPTIYANWQQYGSAAITDPALLQQANQ